MKIYQFHLFNQHLLQKIIFVNPCNNFIIDYLIRTKIKSDKQVSSKYYMYNLAIQSVRKYPLPIICEEQLAALQGFGNFFINRVAKLMKRHYLRGRMPTQSQMEEDDKDHLDGIRQNLKRINQARKQKQEEQEKQKRYYDKKLKAVKNQQQRSNSSQKSDEEAKDYEQKDRFQYEKFSNQGISKSKQKNSQTQKFERILFEQEEQRFKQEQSDENGSEKGSKSKEKTRRNVRKNYRPRKGTQPFQILKAIIDLQKMGKTSIIKGDINQYMFNKRKQKMKGWTQVRERLVQFGYLIAANDKNEDQVMVTDKGRDYMYEVNNYSQQDESSSESSSHIPHKSSKKHPQKQNKPSSSSSTYNKKSYTDSKKRHSRSSNKDRKKQKQKTRQKYYSSLQRQQLSIGRSYKIPTLVYNEKSQINEKDDERIYELLSKITQFNFKDQIINLGQFAWEIDQCLLDCLLFRFKCESFDLDQFFLTCQRAKYVRCQNVYFVFEEALSKNVDNRRDLVNSIFADGRVAGFRMIRTSGLAQTIQFVKKITIDLIKKVRSLTSMLQSQKPMYFLGRIDEYNESLKKFKPTLVRNVAISCLKCVPNITRQMIKKIIRKMPGMWFMFKKLKQLRSNSERKKFLYWYLQQFKPRKGTIRLIVDLMFFDSYDE